MEHDDSVPYQATKVTGRHKLERWKAGWDGENVVVEGPCPICHGDAYGPALPPGDDAVVAALRPDEAPIYTRHIRAECHCGYAHGKDGKASCGRWWHVPVAT